MPGIRLAASALADLEDIRAWYSERGTPEVGTQLVGAIIDRIEALADHPDLGRVVPEFEQPFLRELIHPPFRIVIIDATELGLPSIQSTIQEMTGDWFTYPRRGKDAPTQRLAEAIYHRRDSPIGLIAL